MEMFVEQPLASPGLLKSPHKSSLFRREGNLKKVSGFLTYVTIRGSLGYMAFAYLSIFPLEAGVV